MFMSIEDRQLLHSSTFQTWITESPKTFKQIFADLFVITRKDHQTNVRSNISQWVRNLYWYFKGLQTKNLKILMIDNFFSCHLMVMKLCTVTELCFQESVGKILSPKLQHCLARDSQRSKKQKYKKYVN